MTRPLKILHTGDLHLGLSLRRVSREEEQQRHARLDRPSDP